METPMCLLLLPRFAGSRCCRSCSSSPAWQSWLCCLPLLTECGGLHIVDIKCQNSTQEGEFYQNILWPEIPNWRKLLPGWFSVTPNQEHGTFFRRLTRSADRIVAWMLSNVPNLNIRRFVWTADNHITFIWLLQAAGIMGYPQRCFILCYWCGCCIFIG